MGVFFLNTVWYGGTVDILTHLHFLLKQAKIIDMNQGKTEKAIEWTGESKKLCI